MATSAVPATPVSGGYQQESNTFSDLGGAYKAMLNPVLKVSKNSPPQIGVDITENGHIWDKKTNRLYTVSQGKLRYVQYT